MFALAAFVHSRQVRKEIKAQFEILVGVLRDDLSSQNQRISGIESRLKQVESTKEK